jgi:hypothetical protein
MSKNYTPELQKLEQGLQYKELRESSTISLYVPAACFFFRVSTKSTA